MKHSGRITAEELELVRKVSRAFRTEERQELEAELAAQLLTVKLTRNYRVRQWMPYAGKMLYNKASNWIRDRRRMQAKLVEDEALREIPIRGPPRAPPNIEFQIAFQLFWRSLTADQRQLWNALAESEGNQVKTARLLGKHRNTVRFWMAQIRHMLEKHGLGI